MRGRSSGLSTLPPGSPLSLLASPLRGSLVIIILICVIVRY